MALAFEITAYYMSWNFNVAQGKTESEKVTHHFLPLRSAETEEKMITYKKNMN